MSVDCTFMGIIRWWILSWNIGANRVSGGVASAVTVINAFNATLMI